jgi:Amt family ammonium transporter
MMTAPGLALFYCGLVRKKNVLSVMMQCIFLMGMMSVIWALFGYSLAFAPDLPGSGGFVGGTDYFFMNGVISTWDSASKTQVVPMEMTLPKSLHMVYQMMFFIITPALICGAFAERMKFSAMVIYCALWGLLVYCPLAHWVWSGEGFLNAFNVNKNAAFPAFDFAGGAVVHISSGVSALICALMIGKRKGYGHEPMIPHNLTYTFIGATMLWVGWFGFNAGSALAASKLSVNAFVATHLAAAAGTLSWAGAEWLLRGKPSVLGACSGAVAGLVCITPACGMVTPMAGIILGLLAGVVCFYACNLKTKLGYDDALDAFGVHGVGGTLGAMLTGVFATKAVIGAETPVGGLVDGNANQLINQGVSVLAAAGIGIFGTFILLKIIDLTVGIRVSPQDELQGLDVTQHGEEGYIFL